MKAVVTGAGGQLARELERTTPHEVELVSLSIEDLDITDQASVAKRIAMESPDVLINAAGYTAVDKAEEEEELAMLVNRDGVRYLALAANTSGAKFVHVSTDFVFDGMNSTPYEPNHTPNPLSAYGRSKLAGEVEVQEVCGEHGLVVRTAWLYSSHGVNFFQTMLRLMKQGGLVRVVDDQVGTPTWAHTLASSIWSLHASGAGGIYHVTDSGMASWYEFAVAIRDLAVEKGVLQGAEVTPIRTEEYPTPAHRPGYSVLDCSASSRVVGKPTPHWRTSLAMCLDELVKLMR